MLVIIGNVRVVLYLKTAFAYRLLVYSGRHHVSTPNGLNLLYGLKSLVCRQLIKVPTYLIEQSHALYPLVVRFLLFIVVSKVRD